MSEEIDNIIKKSMKENVAPLPQDYEKKVSGILTNLPKKNKNISLNLKFCYTLAVCIVCFFTTVGVYAAVNKYQERMSKVTEEEKKELNKMTQMQKVDADNFSRDLSEEEYTYLERLHKDYKKGIFPKESITKVEKREQIRKGKLIFCYEDSTFYLPDRRLSKEELLQIIDFWEKRDYAVQEQTAGIEKSSDNFHNDKKYISPREAENEAGNYLKKIYDKDIKNAVIKTEYDNAEVSDKKGIPSYFVTIRNKKWDKEYCVEVDAVTGKLRQMTADNINIDECVSGIIIEEKNYKEPLKEIYRIVSAIEYKACVQKVSYQYKYLKNHTLSRGNVKYLIKLDDNTAYVFLYSLNSHSIYKYYHVDSYNQVITQEKQNEKIQKTKGILTKLVEVV